MFKIGKIFFWTIGKQVVAVNTNGFKISINILWAIIFGWEYFLAYAVVGLILCITIIGIQFGKRYFKLAMFIITPLGHDFQ